MIASLTVCSIGLIREGCGANTGTSSSDMKIGAGMMGAITRSANRQMSSIALYGRLRKTILLVFANLLPGAQLIEFSFDQFDVPDAKFETLANPMRLSRGRATRTAEK